MNCPTCGMPGPPAGPPVIGARRYPASQAHNVRDRGLAADAIADICQRRGGPIPTGTAVGLVARELRTNPKRARRLVENLVADGRLRSVRHRGAFIVIPSLFGWDGWGER